MLLMITNSETDLAREAVFLGTRVQASRRIAEILFYVYLRMIRHLQSK